MHVLVSQPNAERPREIGAFLFARFAERRERRGSRPLSQRRTANVCKGRSWDRCWSLSGLSGRLPARLSYRRDAFQSNHDTHRGADPCLSGRGWRGPAAWSVARQAPGRRPAPGVDENDHSRPFRQADACRVGVRAAKRPVYSTLIDIRRKAGKGAPGPGGGRLATQPSKLCADSAGAPKRPRSMRESGGIGHGFAMGDTRNPGQ